MWRLRCSIYMGSLILGCCVYFPPNGNILKDSKLFVDMLCNVRPTLFFGVPRVWEKMYTSIEDNLKERVPTAVQNMVCWCKQKAYDRALTCQFEYMYPEKTSQILINNSNSNSNFILKNNMDFQKSN